jgi:galactose mutarotase-like enzyme
MTQEWHRILGTVVFLGLVAILYWARSGKVPGTVMLPRRCPDLERRLLAPGLALRVIRWPNRLADGRCRLDGIDDQVALTEPKKHNAIHGFLHWRAWQVLRQTKTLKGASSGSTA